MCVEVGSLHLFGSDRMSPTHTRSEHDCVLELLTAVVQQAEFAATLVDHFLNSLGIRPTSERPTVFPHWFLLDLGAALQIVWWELNGVGSFIPEPLPAGMELVKEIFATADDPQRFLTREPNQELGILIMKIHLRYFARTPYPMRAALVLGRADDDVFIESLARYLWSTRNVSATSAGKV
jgi:hypothetical protein